jgi:hypothetical protein
MENLELTHRHQVSDPAIRVIRGILLLLVVVQLLGMGVELLLMDHFEDGWMMVPLGLIGVSLLALGVHGFARSKASVRAFRLSMLLMMVGGAIGLFLHHRAKEEFQLEGQPTLSGMKLFWEALRGTTPPSLAPAALIQTGLLGLAWAYRHPVCHKRKTISSTSTGDLS